MSEPQPLQRNFTLTECPLTILWARVAEGLRATLGEATYEIWFAGFSVESVSTDDVVIVAPGSMYAIWVEENFKEVLLSGFQKELPGCRRVVIQVATAAQQAEATKASEAARNITREREIAEASVAASGEGLADAVEVSSKNLGKVKPRVLFETVSEEKLLERGRSVGLVEIFQFENFVPGENSQLAWAAAQAVADKPAKTYQPLFFHSACGLGKTHLLHSIGWESLRLRPKSKVIFVTAERFANDYIDAIQKNSLVAFRRRFREADLLLIDDVQFLGRREGMQREFFHTFNSISDHRGQIVLASDCPASEITELEDRLLSRFQWGLSVEIYRPGLETRAAILRRKRDDWRMAVSDDLIDAIVEQVTGNVRVLEGALIRVAMVATMNEEPIKREDVPSILADLASPEECRSLGMEDIKEAVSEHYSLSLIELNGKGRSARVAQARQVAMYLIRTLTNFPLVEIAACFGRDHSTVIHAVKKIKGQCETSASLKSTVELIRRRLVRDGSGPSSHRRASGRSDASGSGSHNKDSHRRGRGQSLS